MKDIVSIPAIQIMIGTLPVTVLLAWNLIKIDRLEAKINDLQTRIDALSVKVGELAERVAKIEGKIEGHHVVLAGSRD